MLVTADDISRSKPHPDGYLEAAARLGADPADCLVIEDAHAGIEAGRAAGMIVLGIATTFTRDELGCDFCIDDLRAIEVVRAPASKIAGRTQADRAQARAGQLAGVHHARRGW